MTRTWLWWKHAVEHCSGDHLVAEHVARPSANQRM